MIRLRYRFGSRMVRARKMSSDIWERRVRAACLLSRMQMFSGEMSSLNFAIRERRPWQRLFRYLNIR